MLHSDLMSRPYVVTSDGAVVASARSSEAAYRASRQGDKVGSTVNRAVGKETVTRFVGNCQWCEGDFKLFTVKPGATTIAHDDLRMVHHGYKRPGHGSIVGDCPGVSELPYERSKALVEQLLGGAEVHLAQHREHLRLLKAGKIDRITRQEWSYDTRGGTKPKLYVQAEVEDWQWRDVLDKETRETERAVDFWNSQVTHFQKRVSNWKLVPARSFEEIAEVEREKRADRDLRVAEKRAARDAKIAATKAKQADLIARREAIAKDLAVKFQSLADAGDVKGGHALARKQKNRMNWLWVDKLGVNAALVKLGLAKWRDDHKRFEDDVWVEHAYFR